MKFEAFIDRRYTSEGRLVSREEPAAVIKEPQIAWDQLYDMVVNRTVRTIDGQRITIKADTYCLHGDHPNSVKIATYINDQLKNSNIELS